jgi:hypothetical protein
VPDIWWASLAFVIGIASGFQGVYEKFRNGSGRAALTLPGISYLATRGALPSVLFAANQTGHFLGGPAWLQAILIGAGAEAILRSRFYVRQTKADGVSEEILRGPLDLLHWYQNLFLDAANAGLAKKTRQFVKRHLPGSTFPELCSSVLLNLDAWPDQQTREHIQEKVAQLNSQYDADPAPASRDERHRLKLGYLILNEVGQSGFLTLLGTSEDV